MTPIDLEGLRALLAYDPETGVFTWRVTKGARRAGSVAGGHTGEGYIQMEVNGRRLLAHRVAFLFMTGTWPPDVVDHINHIRDDNRWTNLRAATQTQNQVGKIQRIQNVSGRRGVSWNCQRKKWQAAIRIDRRSKHLGYYDDVDAAALVYDAAAREAYGEFAGLNFAAPPAAAVDRGEG